MIEESTFTFMPNDVGQLGTHSLLCYMTDQVVAGERTEFKFKVSVLNDPPRFKTKL